jgi:hypothetical protein
MYQQQQRQIPARTQSGLMQTVCIDSATLTTKKLTRCFIFHVSKCRYCAQAGETLQSLADSFYTGLVLCSFSFSGYVWPCASMWCVMCTNARALLVKFQRTRADVMLHCRLATNLGRKHTFDQPARLQALSARQYWSHVSGARG